MVAKRKLSSPTAVVIVVNNTGFAVQLLQQTYTALSEAYPEVDDPNYPGRAGDSFAEAFPMATIR